MTDEPNVLDRHPMAAFAALSALAFAAYFVVFGAVLQRPLTLGDMFAMIERKEQIADQMGDGKIIVAAGSNGRYSHSCEVLSAELGRPCANMSVAATVGPDLLFQTVLAHVGTGDLIYVPLEYPTLAAGEGRTDAAAPWLWRNDRSRLMEMGPIKTIEAAFSYDLRFGIEAIAEMVLNRLGVSRRSNLATLNANGDETTNTAEAAREYAGYITKFPWTLPDAPVENGPAERALSSFATEAKRRGARVVGGLPTTFNDRSVPQETLSAVRQIYRRAGADFVIVEGNSQYPRSAFFDTSDHLQDRWQAEHSRRVALALKAPAPTQQPYPQATLSG
jgi:hypothetical protein